MASGKRSGRLKYNFQLGEVVLCFEPDPTKARVLYDAKILETAQLKARSGQEMPAYRIHFQGWNSSWDRTVGENYILKSNEENRRLMKKLAETAKCYHDNQVRKTKIDDILEKAFKHKPLVFDFESDLDGSDFSEKNSQRKPVQNGATSKNDQSDDSDEDVEVGLTIPKILQEKLEEDFIMINKRNKLLRLPAEPNVISVLEGYVKKFSINVLYGHSNRWKLMAENKTYSADMKSIPMCREVVDGIRICFDFILPTVLLYRFEKDQFSSFMNQQCRKQTMSSMSSQTQNTNSYARMTSSRRQTRKYQRNHSRNCLEKSNLDTEKSIDLNGLNVTELMTTLSSTPTASPSPSAGAFCRRVTRQYVAETSNALREVRQKSRPSVRGRGRRKFKDCGFKRQNDQRKIAGRGRGRGYSRGHGRGCSRGRGRGRGCSQGRGRGCSQGRGRGCSRGRGRGCSRGRGRGCSRGRGRGRGRGCSQGRGRGCSRGCGRGHVRGRRGRPRSKHWNIGVSDVREEPKIDGGGVGVNCLQETQKPAIDGGFVVVKTESNFDTIPKSEPNGCNTCTSATLAAPFSTTVVTTMTATTTSGTSSQCCTLSVPPQLKEDGVPSMSSPSSGHHPYRLMVYNTGSAASSVSSMDLDKGWPYHKEVFPSPPAQSRIDEILMWKLLPPNVYSDCCPQPSLVCGPHQLLRLFVKLPELLGKMDLPDMKLSILVHYLENFLEYLASRHEDLFPISAYVDAV